MKHSDSRQFETPRHHRLFEFVRQQDRAQSAVDQSLVLEMSQKEMDALQEAALQSWAPRP